jgi:hypothetical protein
MGITLYEVIAPMSQAVATDYAAPTIYEVAYRRIFASGEVSDHRMDIQAYRPDIAQTIFYWRIDCPKDLTAQEILSISPRILMNS